MQTYFLFLAFMLAAFFGSVTFEEYQKTKRFEICMKEVKDIEKCISAKKL